jgi:hypothetical protein
MLNNFKNYYIYDELIKTGTMVLHTKDVTMASWQEHYTGVLNLMKDGIETEFLQKTFITVDMGNDDVVELSVMDLYFNLIHWYLIVRSGKQIVGKHLYFDEAITQDTIKDFIDTHFVDVVRKEMDSVIMNNIIDDTLYNFTDVDRFSMFIANTINLEDDIALMNACPEFDDILHTSFQNTPIEDVKDLGMERARRAMSIIIKDSKELIGYHHCLRDPFLSKEGINPRQYKEFAIHIGSKPNGQGGVHPAIIDGSYINGALNSILNQFIDSSSARVAQIQMKNNVGYSGNFARILGLNNIDTKLHDDPTYDCHTNNYQEVEIKNKDILIMLADRYYRMSPNGVEYHISRKDKFLVGSKIYLRSPMTCASAARGNGVCYKCYGDLAYTNNTIKIGKYSAENLSSELTQRQLSAKHLLETIIKKMRWVAAFYKFFSVNINILQLSPDYEFPKGTYMIIDPEKISSENEDDYKKTDYLDDDDDDSDIVDVNYNKFITEFAIETKDGNVSIIRTEDDNPMYISADFNSYIWKNAIATEENTLQIDLHELSKEEDFALFLIKLHNNELSKTLDDIQNVLNKKVDPKKKKEDPEKYNRHGVLQTLIELVLEGKLHITSVHLEILLMNQIRNINSVLDKPDWDTPDEQYQILTLNQSLMDNPSIVISLLYQNLSKILYTPLSFKKTSTSYMDLFFMKQPQNFLSDTSNIVDDNPKKENFCPAVRYRVKK